jgi:hypothetical protein
MTVGSTSLGESLNQRLPKLSVRAAHTVVKNYCGPFQTSQSFNRFASFQSSAGFNNMRASHHDYTTGADREL